MKSLDQLVKSDIEEIVAGLCGQTEIELVTVSPNTLLYHFNQILW